ncbi:STAS domain-containing protein [Shewanella glacialimarina]|uniref:STAS domain-containing protein n=1 Tax=Shewanella glacialimarina TaxID=2590884 RepID=UPI001CF858FA|nr:STAS domain-containing protein [Shewanella glacialimarina]UCX06047.1 STAS domain-containing protein [Shewanella glacialimarina]
MIQFDQQGNTCLVQGRLTQDEVILLWPNRHQLFTASTQVVDLSALTYVDSAGVAMLLALKGLVMSEQDMSSGTISRILQHPAAQLQKMIELYDLHTFFADNSR